MPFCSNCGTKLEENQQFCTNCGANQAAANQAQQQTQQQYYAPPPPPPPASSWDGGVLDTIANSIVASLIITFSCGIATPWAVCYIWKFIIGHVTVDGKRLRFDGKGGDLFGKWLVWMILTCITCGIYSFWVTPKMYNWLASNTHFE